MKWYESRLVTFLMGAGAVVIGVLVPPAAPAIIPGVLAIGWSLKHPADKVPKSEAETPGPR